MNNSALQRLFLKLILPIAFIFPGLVNAATLGELTVQSALSQPFRGEIEVLGLQPQDADLTKVINASPEVYMANHKNYPAGSLGLSMVLEKRPNGRYVVEVRSRAPINEPLFDLVVEIRWGTSKFQRSFTQMLDPADLKAKR